MKRLLVASIGLTIFLVACSPAPATPDEGAIQTAIALTQAADPSETPTSAPTATATLRPCDPYNRNLKAAEMALIAGRFNDKFLLAYNTPRSSLVTVINDMQEIEAELQSYEVPDCGERAKEELLRWMDASIQAYLDFLSNTQSSSRTEDALQDAVSIGNFAMIKLEEFQGATITPAPTP